MNLIRKLNATARRYVREGESVPGALMLAVDEHGLTLATNDPNGYTAIYRTPDGQPVTCWFEGTESMDIRSGGAGFEAGAL